MKLKSILFLSLIFSTMSFSQVFERYPFGQDFYRGGLKSLYAEMKAVAKKQNLQKCEKAGQFYLASVLIDPSGKAYFVKDFDTLEIQRNQCAYDFAREVLGDLKGWNPAKVKDSLVQAIATIPINPNVIIDGVVDRPTNTSIKMAEFSKGNENFMESIKRIIEKDISYNWQGRSIKIIVTISKEGVITDAAVLNSDLTEIRDQSLLSRIRKIRGKWEPATRGGIPIDYKLYMSFSQTMNWEAERETNKNLFE